MKQLKKMLNALGSTDLLHAEEEADLVLQPEAGCIEKSAPDADSPENPLELAECADDEFGDDPQKSKKLGKLNKKQSRAGVSFADHPADGGYFRNPSQINQAQRRA